MVALVLVATALVGMGQRARGMEVLGEAGALQPEGGPDPMQIGASPVTTDYVYLPVVFGPSPGLEGIMANHGNEIYLSDGNCGGLVATQLAGMPLADGG